VFILLLPVAIARLLGLFLRISHSLLGQLVSPRERALTRALLGGFVVSLFLHQGLLLPLYLLSLGDELGESYSTESNNYAMAVSNAVFPLHAFFSIPLGLLGTSGLLAQIKSVRASQPSMPTDMHRRLQDVERRLRPFRSINLVYLPLSEVSIHCVALLTSYYFRLPSMPFIPTALLLMVTIILPVQPLFLTAMKFSSGNASLLATSAPPPAARDVKTRSSKDLSPAGLERTR
jgi:hypothetical protein